MDRCGCGGVYIRFNDGVAVEAGGYLMSNTWTEFRCDRCGCEPHETCEKCKAKEVAESA